MAIVPSRYSSADKINLPPLEERGYPSGGGGEKEKTTAIA
jgi:hypothetical protein